MSTLIVFVFHISDVVGINNSRIGNTFNSNDNVQNKPRKRQPVVGAVVVVVVVVAVVVVVPVADVIVAIDNKSRQSQLGLILGKFAPSDTCNRLAGELKSGAEQSRASGTREAAI